ncbi:LCP family protein [Streptacidiphilus sp. EB103A]|uniref:LCP family protein n=1 Tax=Streptacidiphilus sp. EB103A TaxID=3156275 RepID=UPI0035190165
MPEQSGDEQEQNPSSGIDARTDAGTETGTDAATDPSAPAAPHRRRRRWRILRWVALGLGVVLVGASVTVWLGYRKLNHNIHTDTTTVRLLGPPAQRPTVAPVAYNAENILIIGSDSRDGANSAYGDPNGTARSDTTILLHLSKDRRSAVAMSIPRDAMVQIPACELADGSHTRAQFAQFNWAFEFGGTACTIRTLENLTRIRIDHFMVVDFNGFKNMVNAVGGVQVCLSKPVNDPNAHLILPAGRQTINGDQALGFVRARETLGDGSDTERMGRQQQFLSSLTQKVESNGVLFNPTKLYPLLDAATSAITVDPGLNTVSKLYDLATSLKNLPSDKLVLLTAPREPYVYDSNRDQFQQPQASELFARIRNDEPVQVSGTASASASPSTAAAGDATTKTVSTPSPTTPGPTFSGRTANQDICASS